VLMSDPREGDLGPTRRCRDGFPLDDHPLPRHSQAAVAQVGPSPKRPIRQLTYWASLSQLTSVADHLVGLHATDARIGQKGMIRSMKSGLTRASASKTPYRSLQMGSTSFRRRAC